MLHISSKLFKNPHIPTTLLKLPTPFNKNATMNTIKDNHSFLPVKTPQLTIHKQNSLLLSLPLTLTSILFPDTYTAYASRPLLFASCLTTVPVICPTKFLIHMARFIPPQPGSCLTPIRMNSKPNTIILSQKSVLLPLSLTLLPRLSLTFLQRILPVEIQLIIPLIPPVNIPQDLYPHSHMRIHWMGYQQKKIRQIYILYQEIICITSDNSYSDMSYKILDTYGRIYSTTARLLFDPN